MTGYNMGENARDARSLFAACNAALVAFLVALLAATAVNTTAKPASAHPFGCSAVDTYSNGVREIQWSSSSSFGSSIGYASNTWDAFGRVNIKPYNQSGFVDLVYADYYSRTDGLAGYYTCYGLDPDSIEFNYYYMTSSQYTSFTRNGIAVHELGHALNLAHPGGLNVSSWYQSSLMYWRPRDYMNYTGRNTPGPHDRNDYYATW